MQKGKNTKRYDGYPVNSSPSSLNQKETNSEHRLNATLILAIVGLLVSMFSIGTASLGDKHYRIRFAIVNTTSIIFMILATFPVAGPIKQLKNLCNNPMLSVVVIGYFASIVFMWIMVFKINVTDGKIHIVVLAYVMSMMIQWIVYGAYIYMFKES